MVAVHSSIQSTTNWIYALVIFKILGRPLKKEPAYLLDFFARYALVYCVEGFYWLCEYWGLWMLSEYLRLNFSLPRNYRYWLKHYSAGYLTVYFLLHNHNALGVIYGLLHFGTNMKTWDTKFLNSVINVAFSEYLV